MSRATQLPSVEISDDEVNGPFDLQETLVSAQTAEPEWLREEASFTDVEIFESIPVKYSVSQIGGVDKFTLRVVVEQTTTIESIDTKLKSHLATILGLRDDLDSFYEAFGSAQDPICSTFHRLRGLRLMQATNLFESLIFSILSQNNSVRLLNRRARLLMQHFGRRVVFPDGSAHYLFPSPERLAKCTASQLRSKTTMGYRAKSVVEVSRMIYNEELHLHALASASYDDAFSQLLDLPGVGPKVADCFLLYGLGKREAAPVDVWIHRIVSELYFKGKRISKLVAGRFLRERFRDWAGYAQLYLFDYGRRRPDNRRF